MEEIPNTEMKEKCPPGLLNRLLYFATPSSAIKQAAPPFTASKISHLYQMCSGQFKSREKGRETERERMNQRLRL